MRDVQERVEEVEDVDSGIKRALLLAVFAEASNRLMRDLRSVDEDSYQFSLLQRTPFRFSTSCQMIRYHAKTS